MDVRSPINVWMIIGSSALALALSDKVAMLDVPKQNDAGEDGSI